MSMSEPLANPERTTVDWMAGTRAAMRARATMQAVRAGCAENIQGVDSEEGKETMRRLDEAVSRAVADPEILAGLDRSDMVRRIAETRLNQARLERARDRILEVLEETGMRLAIIECGGLVALTNDSHDDYLSVYDGTWH